MSQTTRLEAALIDHAALLLSEKFVGDGADVWCKAAAELQVLGLERFKRNHDYNTSCAALTMLAVYNTGKEHRSQVSPTGAARA
jgi:hypothetical protein